VLPPVVWQMGMHRVAPTLNTVGRACIDQTSQPNGDPCDRSRKENPHQDYDIDGGLGDLFVNLKGRLSI